MKRIVDWKVFRFMKRYIVFVAAGAVVLAYMIVAVPVGCYDFTPERKPADEGAYGYGVPLDSTSPWPKFRANELQNGRSPVDPVPRGGKPWEFRTKKGIFSSPVVDAEGTVYIGSADQKFYAIRRNGSLAWSFRTGEIIDSAALLDDRGRVYFGSGDAFVYCLDRRTGALQWKTKAHSVEEVLKEFGIKTYNVNWFEGNIGMLDDGTLIAPNDNYLVYALGRECGKRLTQFTANEMVWSLPAVNTATKRMFFGTDFMAFRNLYCYDTGTGRLVWTAGGLGTNAASPLLTSARENGAVVIGGFDGFVRAYAQDTGKQLWKFGARDHIYASAAQLSDGTIVVPSADGTLYAIEAKTGKQKWAFDTLEPIRSSPAVDARDRIYVGSGEGRLFCVNPDGSLRWSYRCIEDDRNDLNSSPALGTDGVYVAGENGGVFFVPYDYPLGAAGKGDPRCAVGPGEDLPPEGVFMLFTTPFGGLLREAPREIDANDPLTFSLFVRRKGDTVLSAIDRDNLRVSVSGNPAMRVDVSANRRFATIAPREAWTGPGGSEITVMLKGTYTTCMARFGLKFLGGMTGGEISGTYTFRVPPRRPGPMPYRAPAGTGGPAASFEFSRQAAPNPSMLPSWNQIGFDSLHYLAGAVEGSGSRAVLWVVGGRLDAAGGKTAVNPALEVRYPLMLEYDGGLLTLHNYDGFKINFIGSWDMPFGFYRLAARADTVSGRVLKRASIHAVALCDEIEFYGTGLKLMGMSEFDTGRMAVFGGMKLDFRGSVTMPSGVGKTSFTADAGSASVRISGGSLKKGEHVYSLLLVNDATGVPLPLYYTKMTGVKTGPDGIVTGVTVRFDEGRYAGRVRAYYMVDTYPAARGVVTLR
ncbi:MAG TPA: PQQ-binding-like beta-propeller repeat protein [Spirochaetota bacterium]|nr:PQQ-binding-like beta-propeller repeat protein [Spirochaetota bacterium]HPN12971.1 PQQ-binding-like beta-propeller repeat protein [Spirochaetota bacterium]